MNQITLIVNPTSGRGRGKRVIPLISQRLRALGVSFTMQQTERPLHAVALARQAAVDGADAVIAVGGDGTVNEVVNGLMQARQAGAGTAMGVLPVGRGNDFAFGVGMPADLAAGCAVLAAGRRKAIDVGRLTGEAAPNGRFFGNSLGIGFDAVVSIEAAKLTWLSGFPSYLVGVLKTVVLYHKGPRVDLAFNGETRTLPTLMISIMNGRRQGGAFLMAPGAENDDGLFDLCVAEQVSRPRILSLVPRFFNGSQFTQPEIHLWQTDELTITAVAGALPAHCDGEIISTDATRMEVTLLHGALDVICPPAERAA